MKTQRNDEARRIVAAAFEQARVFLFPAYRHKHERTEAVLTAAELIRQAIEYAVRGGRTDLGHDLLALAQRIEAEAKQ